MTTVFITSRKFDRVSRQFQTHATCFWEECLWTVGDKNVTKRWKCRHHVRWGDSLELERPTSSRSFLCGESGTAAEAIQVMCDLHPPEDDIPGPRIFPVQHPLTDGLRQITSRTQFPGFTLDWNVNHFCPFALRVDQGVLQLRECCESDHDDFHERRMFSTTFSQFALETARGRSRAFAFPKNPKLAGIPGVLPKPIESIVRRYLTENEMTIAEFRHACGSAIRDMEAVWHEGDVMLSIEAWGDTLVFRFSPA